MPARIVRLQDSHLTHFLHGVGDGSGEADLPHDGQVDEVVAEVGDFLIREAELCLEVRVGRALVEIALVDLRDVELIGAVAQVFRLAPRDDGRLEPRAVRECDAEAVAAEERLEELAFGADVDAAVRQDAVNIKDDEPHALRAADCFCCEFHIRPLPGARGRSDGRCRPGRPSRR